MKKVSFVSFDTMHQLLKDDFLSAVGKIMDQGDFILGEEVQNFERAYAEYSGVEHALGVSNGMDALKICLKTLGIGPGDEVIVPALTYVATAFAVLETGAKPVFVEPDENTFNITAAGIEPAITKHTKAIIPVHLYGQVCDMEAIMALAQKHHLKVVEDNAQSQGAVYNGKRTGSFGHINATSFYPIKNLGALGDAGAITTNDPELAKLAHLYRNVGSEKKYYHQVQGFNARLDTIQAAWLLLKLRYLDEWNEKRRNIAKRYLANLKDFNSIILPQVNDFGAHVFHLFVIRSNQRDKLQQHLADKGIQALIHYPVPNHLQGALKELGYKKGDFPITEKITETCLSLPLYVGMKMEDVDYVSEMVMRFA